jgi:hypothetical protein
VSNVELNGSYAFTFSGVNTGGNAFSNAFVVGRFTADGAGNLTNGEIASNNAGPQDCLTAQALSGTYSIGADNGGVMTLTISGSGTLAFVMIANGNA